MAECCDAEGYDRVFTERFARRIARRYKKKGLNDTAGRMVEFLSDRGLEGASVLEIGGGVGELHVELLKRGAAHVTNLEISTNYEEHAAQLLEQTGLTDRVTRRFIDIAQSPEDVEPADIVVLHRVVCCYPDYKALLTVAGGHARRLLVFSHPPDNVIARGIASLEALYLRLRRNPFRTFVHPADAMVSVLTGAGLTPRLRHRGWSWHVVGLERDSHAA